MILTMLLLSFVECKSKTKQVSVKTENSVQQAKPINSVPTNSIDVASKFCPSGFMGDGEQGNRFITYLGASTENPYSGTTCIKIQYKPGPVMWGGFYWQNKPGNWGDKQGENYTGENYTKVTFYAHGKNGVEVVEFKAGGIKAAGKKYNDSFESSLGKVTLEKNWKAYEINLKNMDLSSVIGGFCWVVSATDNPEGVTFYLDDIKYE